MIKNYYVNISKYPHNKIPFKYLIKYANDMDPDPLLNI